LNRGVDLKEIISYSIEETERLGYKIGSLLNRGDIVCLTGDLGAGKTTLTKAIALGLQVHEDVTSPTFTIINEYMGKLPVYHFDVYRVNTIEEMYDLGYEEYFYGDGVCIIEWASRIEEIIPQDVLWIDIKLGAEENTRIIHFSSGSEEMEKIIEELRK